MKDYSVYCDHCGKKLDALKDYTDAELELEFRALMVDLCKECFDELCEMVCKFCATEKGGGQE